MSRKNMANSNWLLTFKSDAQYFAVHRYIKLVILLNNLSPTFYPKRMQEVYNITYLQLWYIFSWCEVNFNVKIKSMLVYEISPSSWLLYRYLMTAHKENVWSTKTFIHRCLLYKSQVVLSLFTDICSWLMNVNIISLTMWFVVSSARTLTSTRASFNPLHINRLFREFPAMNFWRTPSTRNSWMSWLSRYLIRFKNCNF